MIKWIVISILGLIFLGYLGIDIKQAIHSEATQSNFEYSKSITVHVWNNYLKEPVKFLWSDVFIKYIWDPLIGIINKKIKGSASATDSGALFLS